MDPLLPHDVLRLVIERATEQDLRTARIVRLVSRTTAAWAGPLGCTLLVTARNQARIFDMSLDDAVRRHLAAHVVCLVMASDVDYIGHDNADRLYEASSLLPLGDAAVSILAPFVHLKKIACWPSLFWALSRFPDFQPEQWIVLHPILGMYDIIMSSLSLTSSSAFTSSTAQHR
ncbi:hypothetical protein EXIGLDRAFT_838474 [Exidia glandulosa HHB12029]|uniref:Uncharacterized protein n=1 Tax=Exidia glandulosa HHB12029 TaxID=1314781 RepID=A0A165FTN3_EXIGL|nr:hypothetical protein EXIGLDRAFT_838474 [Exidia glandulosa HHB12029]